MGKVFEFTDLGRMIWVDCDKDVNLSQETFFKKLLELVCQNRVSLLVDCEAVLRKTHVGNRFSKPTIQHLNYASFTMSAALPEPT